MNSAVDSTRTTTPRQDLTRSLRANLRTLASRAAGAPGRRWGWFASGARPVRDRAGGQPDLFEPMTPSAMQERTSSRS